jgi:hypothetical protein
MYRRKKITRVATPARSTSAPRVREVNCLDT